MSNTDEASPVQEVVMLPPHVEPEHRALIEQAESLLREYSERLIKNIKDDLFQHGWNIGPHPSDIQRAEREFHEDPVRALLIRQLANIKFLCERPRFMMRKRP